MIFIITILTFLISGISGADIVYTNGSLIFSTMVNRTTKNIVNW